VFAATDDWGDADWAASLVARIERAAGELAIAVANRTTPDQVDPFADPVPFHRLLAGQE